MTLFHHFDVDLLPKFTLHVGQGRWWGRLGLQEKVVPEFSHILIEKYQAGKVGGKITKKNFALSVLQ